MDPFQALCELPGLIEEYKKATAELAEVKRELELFKNDQYVTWNWVCEYFGISKVTAMEMLANEKVFVHGPKIKRFKRSAIIKFGETHSLKVKEIAPMPYRNNRQLKRNQ